MASDNGGVSGIGVAAVFAGGILVWSGVKGLSVSGLARDLIAGKDPKNLQQVNKVSIGGLIAGVIPGIHLTSSPVGSPSVAPGTGRFSPSFAKAVLSAIGAPQTQANIDSIIAWAHREGGGGTNNPLNTTLSMPGATDFNSVGVKNYSSMSVGVLATAKTILGGNYSDVLSALRSGGGLCGQSFAGLSTWSGGGYSSVC